MIIEELQTLLALEAICLFLIIVIIISAFKRWKLILLASGTLATIVFCIAWSWIMALSSALVYGSASTLLLWQLDQKNSKFKLTKKYLQDLLWITLAAGVTLIIIHNINNIYLYLG